MVFSQVCFPIVLLNFCNKVFPKEITKMLTYTDFVVD